MAVAAPVAVRLTLRALLIPLTQLLACLVAIGLVYCADGIVRALFGTLRSAVGWIPFAGRVIKKPISEIERKFIHYLAAVERDLSARVGRYFDGLAHNILALSKDVYDTAIAISQLAWYVETKIGKAALGSRLDRTIAKAIKAEREAKQALRLAHDAHGAITKPASGQVKTAVTVATRPLAARVGRLEHTTDARLDRLEATVPAAVPRIGSRTGGRDLVARREIDRLWKRVRRLDKRILGAGAAALTWASIARLRLGWLRCGNVGKFGRAVCRMDSRLLDALLFESLLISGSLSIVEFAKELQGVTEFTADAVHGFIREG